jgi:hypothetical protein
MFMFVTATPSRIRSAGLRAAVRVRTTISAVRARLAATLADEAGLTTAEYVALGAVVVVAAGGVGALIAAFLNAKAGQIIGTP